MSIHFYDPQRCMLDTEQGRSFPVPFAIANEPSVLLEAQSVERWARKAGLIGNEDEVACAA